MSKRGRLPTDVWEVYRAMSVDVGKIVPFLKDTACMGLEERKLLAYCETAKEFFGKDDVEFTTFIDGFAKPFIVKVGQARWGRDVVTDLGFALSGRPDMRKKLGESLLKFQPEGTE